MIDTIIYQALGDFGIEPELIEIEVPKFESQGDLSTPVAMAAAKKMKKAPRDIAAGIVEVLKGLTPFETVEVAGPGFVNLRFTREYLFKELKQLSLDSNLFLRRDVGKGKTIQIEFVSANPTGPLHLGHGRGAALGAALANLLERAGYRVEKEFYVNDAGRQVRLLGESVFARYQSLLHQDYPFPEDGYKGDYTEHLAQAILATEGGRFAGSSFQDEVKDFFINYSYKEMLKQIKSDLADFGVLFDRWQSEREIYDTGLVQSAMKELRAKGYVYDDEGAVWFKSTLFGDEKDRVVVKSDGQYTYFASDISYHALKVQRGFDELVNIWGADHHGYIPRIKAVLAAQGFDPGKLSVILVQMVSLLRGGKPVQMSKRAGEFVTLREIMDELGSDTTKFIFLTRRSDSHLEFDIEVAKKESAENPVFYVQYAFARIESIFRKARETDRNTLCDPEETKISLLNSPEELRIIKKLILYPLVFQSAVRTREPHRMTFFLQELSSLFHPYYNTHRVLTDDEALTGARLFLCTCIQKVLEEGLSILGISAPQSM